MQEKKDKKKDSLVLDRVKSTSGTVGAEGVKDCAYNNWNQRCEKHEFCSASQSAELFQCK